VESKSLISHREVMTSQPTTDPSLMASARKFAAWFAQRHFQAADLVERVSPTPSASLSTGRRAGGTREEARRLHRQWIQSLPLEHWTRPDALTFFDPGPDSAFLPQEVESVRSNQGSADVARAAAWLTATRPLMNRVTTVAERGYKCRVVSAPEAHATVAGSVLNKALLKGVSRYAPCSLFLKGKRREAMERVVRSSSDPDSVFVSTDLSAATDRLPHDLVRSIVMGIVDGWEGLPDLWAEALFALTGEQDLRYPWGQEVKSSCGVLMGLGPSWPIMSIIHAWWFETALKCTGRFPTKPELNTVALGGDDLFGRWRPEVRDAYRSIVSVCNGKRSAGKDYESPTAGNFTEISVFVKSPGSVQYT